MWQLKSREECVFQPSSTALVIDEAQEEGTLPNLLVSTATSDTLTAAGYSQGMKVFETLSWKTSCVIFGNIS